MLNAGSNLGVGSYELPVPPVETASPRIGSLLTLSATEGIRETANLLSHA